MPPGPSGAAGRSAAQRGGGGGGGGLLPAAGLPLAAGGPHAAPMRACWWVEAREDAAEYHLGCLQLLTLCGPRLRELQLQGVQRWQGMSFRALRRCTALVSLELVASWSNLDAALHFGSWVPVLWRSALPTIHSRGRQWLLSAASAELIQRPHGVDTAAAGAGRLPVGH